MRTKVVAPIALSVGLLGLVGGVAATQAFHPVAHVKPQVQLVQPAAQTVTVTPSPTTTDAPVKTTAAPKPVSRTMAPKPAPVQTTQSAAPRVVQKAAVVSTDTSTSVAPAPAPSSSSVTPSGVNPPPPTPIVACPVGSTKPGCGNNPGGPSGSSTTH